MFKQGIGDFKYYVGISSLSQIATREDRVCVLNILGGESSDVTPVGHVYSGGNVVFGTSPGEGGAGAGNAARQHPGLQQRARGPGCRPPLQLRRGLPAALGRARRRGRADPRQPGAATRSSSSPRRCRCTTRARSARWASRTASTSSAATAWAWPTPGTRCASAARWAATARPSRCSKGSIAIFSNSGGFTTTIAQYLRMAGWGTTTVISSGKDVYIHYAAPEFAFALANDARSKAAVLYCRAGRLLRARRQLQQAGGGLRGRALEEPS